MDMHLILFYTVYEIIKNMKNYDNKFALVEFDILIGLIRSLKYFISFVYGWICSVKTVNDFHWKSVRLSHGK